VLQDGLEGAIINGVLFRRGAKTLDQLIEEYRRHLMLPSDLAEGVPTDIDRVTGVGARGGWRRLGPLLARPTVPDE
jgi:hypothetical protein